LDGSKKKRGTKKKSLWVQRNIGGFFSARRTLNDFAPCTAVTAVTTTHYNYCIPVVRLAQYGTAYRVQVSRDDEVERR